MKTRIVILILLALLAGGLACTAWGMGPGWPGGAPGRNPAGAAFRNVARLRPSVLHAARGPTGEVPF